jgi:hypothetical protein
MGIMHKTRYVALAVALSFGAFGGCHSNHYDRWDRTTYDPHDDDDDDEDLLLAAVVLGAIAVIAIAVTIVTLMKPAEPPPVPSRAIPTVRGQLVDAEGKPIAGATLLVRTAPNYIANPEKLPAVSLQTEPDGNFVLPMTKANAMCVDFTADGKRPERRWFVLLVPEGLRGLPADQRDITFLSPTQTGARVARLTMLSDP